MIMSKEHLINVCANFGVTNSERAVARTHNKSLAKVAVQYSADTIVVNQSLILRNNICDENRQLLVARER